MIRFDALPTKVVDDLCWHDCKGLLCQEFSIVDKVLKLHQVDVVSEIVQISRVKRVLPGALERAQLYVVVPVEDNEDDGHRLNGCTDACVYGLLDIVDFTIGEYH